tara:strand:+ start:429 stop:920 length:492 start_codon:yes stop_codon:yes gene_type:complete
LYKYKNVLSWEDIRTMNEVMLGDSFPWYFYPNTVIKQDNNFMFVHMFVRNTKINSDFFYLLEPLLNYINEKKPYEKIERVKANLYTNQNKNIKHGSHHDLEKDNKNGFISLFNLTTCNGSTIIDNKKHLSKKNELMIFDNVEHYGITQTDTQSRVCINFNFLT